MKASARHFLFHLMGIRPDSRAVRLAIFRVRLCSFVEGVTKEGPYLLPPGWQRQAWQDSFRDLAGSWEMYDSSQKVTQGERSGYLLGLGHGAKPMPGGSLSQCM
jgi:hypothetical protein